MRIPFLGEERERGYLSTISRRLGLQPKSLYQLRRTWVADGRAWPKPVDVLPDGKELFDVVEVMEFYERHAADMGRKGSRHAG